MGEDEHDHRLPTHVRPVGYDLLLRIDPDAEGFTGRVTITTEVDRSTDRIVLHALDLDIASVTITDSAGTEHSPEVRPDAEREWIVLQLPAPIPTGATKVQLEHSGRYGENLVGLYTSEFDLDGQTARLAVTQCESTHARRILPCFDEPAFKATFTVALEVPEGLTAVSNGAETARGPAGSDGARGFERIDFAPTIPMSSYLLAAVVGPLEVTEAPDVHGTENPIGLRVVHPPGKSHLTGFAIEVATAALGFFEDYYALAYPGDKIDLVAIPDFAFGAMENHGCITFREVLLLVDPDSATPLELQRVADVINHELAHMWFGNLVTMGWWNGIWLNEAFATFMEISASDAFRPEWDVWTTFGLARSAAFDTDALRSTRPIEFEVVTASDSEAMFDILTYEKGASVLRMLEQYLGPEAFREGIRRYLRTHAFANTGTSDLWLALEEATGEPVRRVAEAWIFRGGHPLLRAQVSPPATLELSQQRALYRHASAAEQPEDPFPVPLRVLAEGPEGSGTEHTLILEETATVQLAAEPSLLRINARGSGFFRCLLPRDLRRAVLAEVDNPLERFVVLDDTWFTVLAGEAEPAEILETISAMVDLGEDDPSIWRRGASILAELERLVSPAQHIQLQSWTNDALGEMLRRYPPLTATGREAELSGTVMGVLGTTGTDPAALAAAAAVFDGVHGDIHPAVRAAALEVVAREPDDEQFTRIRRRWRDAVTPQEEQRHLAALVATENPAQFAEALHLCLNEARPQDGPYTLRRALANRARGTDAWDFVVDNFEAIVERFPSGALPRMLEGIRGFTDEWTALAVQRFLADHPLPTGSQQIEQHVERMNASVAAAARIRQLAPAFWAD